MMLFKYSTLLSNISASEIQRVTNIFAEHGIQYKIKAKMPFGMHPFDSATIGGVGRTSGNFEVRYSILIKKDNIEYALSLIKT